MATEITKGAIKDAQVSTEVQRQSNLLGELREMVDKLEERLANVTTKVPEVPTEAEPESAPLVLLAEEIAASNDGVTSCILALKSILRRIEI